MNGAETGCPPPPFPGGRPPGGGPPFPGGRPPGDRLPGGRPPFPTTEGIVGVGVCLRVAVGELVGDICSIRTNVGNTETVDLLVAYPAKIVTFPEPETGSVKVATLLLKPKPFYDNDNNNINNFNNLNMHFVRNIAHQYI